MQRRPNILILTGDQLTQRAIGAYGDAPSRTPNLDALAKRGVAFANAYTPCPLCMPARAALWTSQYPHATGIRVNDKAASVPAALVTLGDTFAQAGYRCVHTGKTHDMGALRGFELLPEEARPVEDTPPWTNYWDTQCDRGTTARATEFLEAHGDQPYMLAVEYNNPHDICLWIGDHIGAHADTPVPGALPPLPANFETPDLASRPLAVRYNCCSNFRVAQTLAWTPENFRHYLAAYYHYVAMLDRELGTVLEALARRADAANTLIVFLVDHGDGMTSHRMVTKSGHFYEEVTRIPLIMAGPGVTPQRHLTRAPLASLLDLYPTLCDCAGVAAPAGLAGRSLRPWLGSHGGRDSRAYVVATWMGHPPAQTPGRMVRSHRFKYTHFREDSGEELFDLIRDPGEQRNLAGDPAHAAALAEHRALLQAHCVETGDPYFTEPVSVTAPAHAHPPEHCPLHG